MKRNSQVLAILLVLILVGCGRGNGIPSDLISHLAQAGIHITLRGEHAPMSSRGGYLVVDYSSALATDIIAKFKLRQVTPSEGLWALVRQKLEAPPTIKEMWGIGGRPQQLRLKDDAQFEFLYLIITTDGLMYLVAEYAYG